MNKQTGEERQAAIPLKWIPVTLKLCKAELAYEVCALRWV